jgi:hypothetical protein
MGRAKECSGGLFVTLPRTLRKTAYFLVGIIGKAEQRHPRNEYAQPSNAENDPH